MWGDTRLVFPQKGGPPAWEAKQPLLVWSPANNHQQHRRRRQCRQADGPSGRWWRHSWCGSWGRRWRWSQAVAVMVVIKVWLTDCFWLSAKADWSSTASKCSSSSLTMTSLAQALNGRMWSDLDCLTADSGLLWPQQVAYTHQGCMDGSGRHYSYLRRNCWTILQTRKQVLCWINLCYWLLNITDWLFDWTYDLNCHTSERAATEEKARTFRGTLGTPQTTWLLGWWTFKPQIQLSDQECKGLLTGKWTSLSVWDDQDLARRNFWWAPIIQFWDTKAATDAEVECDGLLKLKVTS